MTESETSKSKQVPKFLLVLELIKFVHFQAQTDPFAWRFNPYAKPAQLIIDARNDGMLNREHSCNGEDI